MTATELNDSKAMEIARTYHFMRARPGFAVEKGYWVGEFRMRVAVINSLIIQRKTTEGSKDEGLKEAYDNLKKDIPEALRCVFPKS